MLGVIPQAWIRVHCAASRRTTWGGRWQGTTGGARTADVVAGAVFAAMAGVARAGMAEKLRVAVGV